MLGEIFGRSAGLTRLVLTLFLFFGFRALFGSFLSYVVENAGLVGVDMASSMGLGLPDTEAPPAVLSGFSFGILRAGMRGVSASRSRMAVSNLESSGRSKEGSGSVRSSRVGGAPRETLKLGEGCMRINEAGVAGAVL